MPDEEKPKEQEQEQKPEPEETAPEPKVRVALPDDLKAKMDPNLVAAVEAGCPVVVIIKNGETIIRTFEKSYASSRKKNLTPEEQQEIMKGFNDLIDIHDFLQNRVKEADEQWKKMFDEHRQMKKDLKARKEALRSIKLSLRELSDRYPL